MSYAESPSDADIVLINSYVYSEEEALPGFIEKQPDIFKKVTFVHRIDGPVSLYRGNKDDKIDRLIFKINEQYAKGTIFQSEWSKEKNKSLGLKEKKFEAVIPNATDKNIFYPPRQRPGNGKIRLIAVSWSDNINKGFDIYEYLDKALDFEKFSFTFVGRSPVKFENIRHVPPLTQKELAEELRKNEIFISASKFEACSNSLIEAMACGCIPVARGTSSQQEIVEDGGIIFHGKEDVIRAVNDAAKNRSELRKKLTIPSIEEIGKRYTDFFAAILDFYGKDRSA